MIGTDIIAIPRMQTLLEKHPQRLAEKILHPEEYPAYHKARDQARYLAKHWAAKEAIAKAIGTGLRAPLVMPAICINKSHLGQPLVSFHHTVSPLLHQHNIKSLSLSLSDEQTYIVAFALCHYQNNS